MNLKIKLIAAVFSLTISVMAYAESENTESIAKIVADGLNLAAYAKLTVSEHYLTSGQWPSSNDLAVYGPPPSADRFEISVGDAGLVEIVYSAPEEIAGKSVMIRPTPGDVSVRWACYSEGISDKFLPASCK